MPTNKELEKEVSSTSTWVAFTAIWLFVLSTFLSVHTVKSHAGWKLEYLERVTDTQRDDIMSLSWRLYDMEDNDSEMRKYLRTELDNIEYSKYAKIYDLSITICKIDKDAEQIKKRHVTMKNVVGINPSVERTATTVYTWLWYGSSVEIPTIMDDEDEYACGLEVISVR